MSIPPKAATSTTGAGRRSSVNPSIPKSQNTPTRAPSRPTSLATSSSATSSNSTATSPTVRSRPVKTTGAGSGTGVPPPSARAAVRRSMSHHPKASIDGTAEADARAAAAAAMDDLRERLQKAELAADEQMKHAATLQARLDDAIKEQSKLEESVHEQQERMEEIENEKKENIRKRREIESIYETEQAAAIKEREEAQAREEELRNTVQRLKEAVAQRELRLDDDRNVEVSRSSSFRSNSSPRPDSSHFAPPSSHGEGDSRSSSRLILQKDKIIESLRLELAETQIKIAELENMGGGRVQELERSLLEARVANGRLMEDNESFQLLLAEKTMHGDLPAFLMPPSDYSRPPSPERPTTSTLADELNDDASFISRVPSNGNEIDPVEHRRILSEMSSLKDQNKALSLYISNIITRLLQHKEFENILDKTPKQAPNLDATQKDKATTSNKDKDLPPPPPPKDNPPPSLLQRATSVVRGRPRQQTLVPEKNENVAPVAAAVTEDPATAPRVPFARPHRRANSEWSHAAVVGNMYRGPSPVSGQVSPGFAPPQRASSFFGNNKPAAVARMASTGAVPQVVSEADENGDDLQQRSVSSSNNRDSKISSSSRNSIVSDGGGGGSGGADDKSSSNNPSSPPRSTTSGSEKPSGAIIGGNRMRPLRLVQEANEEEEAKKKANRSSWMGWFNKGANAPAPAPSTLPRSVSGDVGVPPPVRE